MSGTYPRELLGRAICVRFRGRRGIWLREGITEECKGIGQGCEGLKTGGQLKTRGK